MNFHILKTWLQIGSDQVSRPRPIEVNPSLAVPNDWWPWILSGSAIPLESNENYSTVFGKIKSHLKPSRWLLLKWGISHGRQLHLSPILPRRRLSFWVSECTFESDNCKLCKIINFQLTICGPHRALLFGVSLLLSLFRRQWVILALVASQHNHHHHHHHHRQHYPRCVEAFLGLGLVLALALVLAALCTRTQRSTWPCWAKLDTHRPKEKDIECAIESDRVRAAAHIQEQADPKQKMSNFVIYYPNPVSVSDSLGVSLRQRHTERPRCEEWGEGAAPGTGPRRVKRSPLSHTACEFVAQYACMCLLGVCMLTVVSQKG